MSILPKTEPVLASLHLLCRDAFYEPLPDVQLEAERARMAAQNLTPYLIAECVRIKGIVIGHYFLRLMYETAPLASRSEAEQAAATILRAANRAVAAASTHPRLFPQTRGHIPVVYSKRPPYKFVPRHVEDASDHSFVD